MGKIGQLKRSDLVYPELSFEIVGCAYSVFNELGGGLKESVYQKAMAINFRNKKWNYKEQFYSGEKIGKRFLDFLIDEKVIVELKRGGRYSKAHIDQVFEYLKISNLQLAILINFGSDSVIFKRIVNII
jgi:GxxExxY protein